MNQTKSTSKKLLALLLALIMTVSLLPMSVFAAELEQTDADGQPVVEQGVDDAVTDGQDEEDVTLPEEPAEDVEPEEDVTLPGDEETDDEVLLAAENGIAVQAITIAEKPIFSGTTERPFVKNIGAGSSFRIPAMVTLNDGTIVAAADARWDQAQDGGGNDTIVAYSTDGGNSWNHTFANYLGDNGNEHNDKSTCFIDPALATDGTTVYMLVDLFPHGRATLWQSGRAEASLVAGSGFTSDGCLKLSNDTTPYLTETNNYNYYLKDHRIYSGNNPVSDYWVDDYFNIYEGDNENGKYLSNLFFADSPYRVYPTGYLYLTTSTDSGATWSAPTLINLPETSNAVSNESACIVGPGRGTVTSDGTIIFPVYGFSYSSYYGSVQMQTGFIYSKDGVNWTRSNSGINNSSESDIVELSNGTLRVFYRTTSDNKSGLHYVDVTKNDGGYEWGSGKTVTGATSYSDCQLSAIKYSKTVKVNGEDHEAIIVSCPAGNNRTNGYLYLLDAKTMTALASYQVSEKTNDNYQYSCLTELQNGNIGLLYETHGNSATITGEITYATYTLKDAFGATVEESTVTPDKPNTGETDPSTPSTPSTPATGTIVIKVGVNQTVEKSYTFDADVDVEDGKYSDDVCTVTWEASTVAGGTTVGNKVTSPTSGTTYLISDGTNYLTVDANGSLGNTTNKEEATQWTYSNSRFSATVGNTPYYLRHNNDNLTVGTSTSKATWTVDTNGIYYGSNSRYLCYNNGWSVVRDATQSTRGYTYSFTTNAPVNAAKLNVTGNAPGTSKEDFTIGNKKFRVEVVDGYFAEVAVGGTATISLSEANVTLQEGQTVVWTVGDDGKYAGIYSQDGTNATLTGREKTPDSTTTIATATVKKADGTVAATYNWLVTVTDGTQPNEGTATVTYTLDETLYNGKIYYSVDGGPLLEAPYTEKQVGTDTVRTYETIEVEDAQVDCSILTLFVKPDDGYALTVIKQTKATVDGASYADSTPTFCPINKVNLTLGGTAPDSKNRPKDCLTSEQEKAMFADAVEKGCDATFWYSSGTLAKGGASDTKIAATHEIYCDKLPTIDKEISHLIMDGKVVDYTTDGMVADAGDRVVFKITVTCYPERANITYTDGSLNDIMTGIELYSDAKLDNYLSDNLYDITTDLDADRVSATQNTTYTYYAAYKLTPEDLQQGRKLENKVELTYTYQSQYSKGAYGGASEANAAFQLTDFPQINDIVVDFGLPVKVLDNVTWAENYRQLITVKEKDAKYGDVTADGDNKGGLTVIYTPTTMTREIDTVTLTSSRGNTSTFHVIPASTVYYEDSFASFYDNAGTEQTSFQQSGGTDIPGKWYVDNRNNAAQSNESLTQALEALGDKQNVYGYDAAYDSCTTFSMGSAKKVTVNADTYATYNTNPTAQFTFKGTGFDVISLTDNTSGAIRVDVYHKGADFTADNRVRSYFVNNYYGYTYNNGSWEVKTDTEGSNALYQIPVMKVTGLDYGEYTVVITAAYNKLFDTAKADKYSFWLDAIRVYDPMGPAYDYTDDQEGYPQYIKLRDELAKDNSTVNHTVLFIDGKEDADIQDYTNYGPNNEVYLLKDQNIAFKLNIPAGVTVASVQIGAKAPMGTGKSAVMKVNGQQVGPKNGDETGNIASATEMYYDITTQAKDGQQVTITNFDGEGILSLTNLKITFTSDPGETKVALDTLTDTEQANAVQMVRAMYAPAPEPDPEPVVFAPERFEASWSRSTVKVGQKATLTVKTSEDVEAITVDGVTIDTYRTRTQRTGWGWNAKRVTYREFTYTITAKEAGTLNCSVAAVNGENVASEPITAALTVQAAAQRPSWGGWLGNLFGRWF